MYRRYIIFTCSITILVLIILYAYFVIIAHDYRIDLPGDYELIRAYSGGISIGKRDSWEIIGKNVDGYKVIGCLVVGHVSLEQPSGPPPQEVPGYFILNTKNGKVQKGMTKNSWLSALKHHGISIQPTLQRPKRLNVYLEKIGFR